MRFLASSHREVSAEAQRLDARTAWRWGIKAVAAACGALLASLIALPGYAEQGQGRSATATLPEGTALKDLRLPEGAEHEQQLRATVERAFSEAQAGTAWKQLKILPLSPQELALFTLNKNLTISASQDEARRARAALQEAAAVFDPVLTLSFGYQRQETHERTEPGTVEARVFRPLIADPQRSDEITNPDVNDPDLGDPNAPRGVILLSPQVRELTGIDRIVYTKVRTERTRQAETIFASRADPNGPSDRFEYTVALDQQLPWGARYNIGVLTADQEVFYDLRGNSYGASWSSSLLFNLELPIPGAKDFGPYAPFDTQLKLTRKDRERAFWLLQSTINDNLLAANLAYLELLEALESFAIQIENRTLLAEQLSATRRLFQARQATTYDVAQVEAELSRAQADEEAAANRLIAASEALSVLIEDSPTAVKGRIYVPSSYSPWLERRLAFDETAALKLAKQNQPLLQVSRVAAEQSEILRQQARQQVRPDVRANVQIESLQNGALYGYDSFGESWGAVANPDTLNQSYGVDYRYPFANRAFKARLARASSQLSDSRLELRQTSNDVIRDVNGALIGIKTSRARLARSNQQLQAAEQAYDSLARRAEAGGDVNRNELVLIIRRLLAARLARVSAQIDNKRAESALLAAQGLLARHYGPWTARNAFETHRLQQLQARKRLAYFLD